ncbi:MAG: O-antigen ligase family protein [Stappiaceae bacterium]
MVGLNDYGSRFQTNGGPGVHPEKYRKSKLDMLELYLAAAIVFFAPLNFLRHPSFYMTVSDLFVMACILVMLVNRTLPLRPFEALAPVWMTSILMIIAGLMLGSIINGDPTRGLVVTGQYFFALFVLPLVLVARPWGQLILLIKVFVLSIVISCLAGVYFIHIDGETNTVFVSGNGRWRSFMERTNSAASVFAMTIPLVIWLAEQRLVRKTVAMVTFLIILYGLMLTGSNTGILAALFGLGFYFLISITWARFFIGLGLMIATVVIVGAWGEYFLPEVFQRRVLGSLESGNLEQAGTFVDRVELILEALRFSNGTIFLGFGADQYSKISSHGAPVHNAYLLLLTEGGLLGLSGFLLLMIVWFTVPFVNRRPGSSLLTPLICVCIASVFAAMANGTAHFYARFWMIPITLALAISIAMTRFGDVPEDLRVKRFARRRR